MGFIQKIKNFFKKEKVENFWEPLSEEEYDKRYKEYQDTAYAELPKWVKEKSVGVLRETLPVEVTKEVYSAWEADPLHWCSLLHFSWGMAIRNLLRKEVCLDEKLPSGNWDDYYVQLVEVAVGAREL